MLSALQFWGALVVPCLLTTRSQLLKYLEWRRERLGQQRQQRREQRRIASSAATSQRAGAAATSQAPLGSGSSKSSPASAGSVGRGLGSGGSSSGRSSLSSDSIDETAGLFASPYELRLAQLLKPPRRGGKPHPDDWCAWQACCYLAAAVAVHPCSRRH